jgi:Putative Actinobacterial Holin-X, holin superfamily III
MTIYAPPPLRQRERPGISPLVLGLVGDFKQLMAHEVRLAKHEVQEEIAKVRMAAVSAGIGIALLTVAGLLLVIMLVHLLHAIPAFPLWICYGIVGVILLASGGLFLRKGTGTVSDLHLVPRRVIQTTKENATWMKEQAKSAMR